MPFILLFTTLSLLFASSATLALPNPNLALRDTLLPAGTTACATLEFSCIDSTHFCLGNLASDVAPGTVCINGAIVHADTTINPVAPAGGDTSTGAPIANAAAVSTAPADSNSPPGVQNAAVSTTSQKPKQPTPATTSAAKATTPAAPPKPGPNSVVNIGGAAYSGHMIGGWMTVYEGDLGGGVPACGYTAGAPIENDFYIAISFPYFQSYPGSGGDNPNGAPICGRKVDIHYHGTTTRATVWDKCQNCSDSGRRSDIDLSPALWKHVFGDLPAQCQFDPVTRAGGDKIGAGAPIQNACNVGDPPTWSWVG